MKAILFFSFVVLFIIPKTDILAQLVAFKAEDIDILKQEKVINLEFSFDSMEIITPVAKYKTEDDYIRGKVKEHNDAKPGKGNEWLADWNRNKIVLFEPAFVKYMNKRLKKYDVEVGKNQPKALYTILVKILLIDTGWPGWAGVYGPATVNLEIIIFKTQSKSKIVARYYFYGITGAGGDNDYSSSSGKRIEFAFRNAGYLIGNLLKKKVYK